ncbi:unnamed protein product [Angiostrongylus costaricensis]|uniref:Vacuolar protein sorting-associated protein 51 homolog n=1 Tax=Angiostrongylus costaricensis TaxID=334426 RepID=A0A0R3PU36_ANGCS|nr:unnamed protein product [Angiostrongylus costaricensis]
MAHLVSNRVFVDTVVKDVTEFVSQSGVLCKPEIISDEDQYRPDSPLLMEIESDLQKKGYYEALQDLLSRVLDLVISVPVVFIRTIPHQRQTTYLRQVVRCKVLLCTVRRQAVLEVLLRPYSSRSCLSDLDSPDTDEVKLGGTNVDDGCERTNAVLSYLSLIRSPDYRIGRILRRLASCRLFIDSLLSMQFHMRVFYALCTPPCRVVRYAKRCARCERAADFGREILKVFSAHVDSDFGDSFLIKRLSSDDFTTRIVAGIAKIVLIRDRFRLGRMSYGRLTALELLFESLHSLLTGENFHEICEQPTYKGGPPVCAQIVAAMSTLIAPQRLRISDKVFELDQSLEEVPFESFEYSGDVSIWLEYC